MRHCNNQCHPLSNFSKRKIHSVAFDFLFLVPKNTDVQNDDAEQAKSSKKCTEKRNDRSSSKVERISYAYTVTNKHTYIDIWF